MSEIEIGIWIVIVILIVIVIRGQKNKCPLCKAKMVDRCYIGGFKESYYKKCTKCNHKE
jgi:hypothetical protein